MGVGRETGPSSEDDGKSAAGPRLCSPALVQLRGLGRGRVDSAGRTLQGARNHLLWLLPKYLSGQPGGRHPPVATATLDHLGQDRDACLPADGAVGRFNGRWLHGPEEAGVALNGEDAPTLCLCLRKC